MADPASLSLPALESLFSNIYGLQLAANFVSCVMYGICCLQVFIYYMSAPKDNIWIKMLPGWLIVFETIHQFLFCVGIYKINVNNFGNPSFYILIVKEFFVATMFQGWITIAAQAFFIYRIYKFGGKKLLFFPFVFFPLSVFVLVLIIIENTLLYNHGIVEVAKTGWMTYSAHAVNIFLDGTFMFSMIYLLKLENSSLFKKTNNMINRLIILTVNTGMVTLLCTLLTIVLYKTKPATLDYVFFNTLVSPLYCNSVLANLNSREYVRGDRRVDQTGGSEPPSILELGQMRYPSATSADRKTRGSDTRVGNDSSRLGQVSVTSSLGNGDIKGVKVTTETYHGDEYSRE